jgi:hypothetical protein
VDVDEVVEQRGSGARRRPPRGGAGLARRWAPLAAIVVGVWWASLLALMAVGTLVVVDGAAGVAAAAVLGVMGLFGVPLATWGVVTHRRRRRMEQEVRRERNLARDARSRARAMPVEVRDDWRRLERARALVGQLADDGWITSGAVVELDGHVVHLQKVAWADHRARELGGRESDRLAHQVADLADLLVALADEAVDHQADVAAGARAPVTLAQARDRLVALREARVEVREAEPRGRPG